MSTNWANLPRDLLQVIGERLGSRTDVSRFRAVCSSWRSSVSPSFKHTSPTSPALLKIPHPINAEAFLSQATICCLQLPHQDGPRLESCEHQTAADSSSSSMSWLTKLEESTRGDLQLLSPFSNAQITSSCPKKLNVSDFNVVELSSTCSLKLEDGRCVLGVDKVVLLDQSPFYHGGVSFDLLVIYDGGKLAHWRTGDEKWTPVDEQNPHYHDILLYKDRPYVVDGLGAVSWMNSSLELVQCSAPLFGYRTHKYNLVESCGDLYVVDRQLNRPDQERRTEDYYGRNQNFSGFKTVDVMVFKLDQELGTWVDVRSLEDRVFVVANECCFSVDKDDFRWREGSCVYFNDHGEEIGCHGELSWYNNARVCNLKDGNIRKVASLPDSFHIFWPPIGSNPSLFGNITGYLQHFARQWTPLYKRGILAVFN